MISKKYLFAAATAIALSTVAGVVSAQQPPAPAAPAAPATPPPRQPLGFFVASTVPGTGNLGGLAGADKICQDLATAAGAGGRTWRAYLSTQAVAAQGNTPAQPAVNARDRIGAGPWFNAATPQARIAANVADLHGDLDRDRNYVNKLGSVDENGKQINGVGDTPNQHDVFTGSDSYGRAFLTGQDMTCGNWTSAEVGPGAGAMLGHTDRLGGGNTSWNMAHRSAGCDAPALVRTGGAGKFYCFAAN